MKIGTLQRLARKATAVLLSAAVILAAPGLSAYQAVAGELGAGKESAPSRKAKIPPQIKPVEGLSLALNYSVPAAPISHPAGSLLPAPAAAAAIAPASGNAPVAQTLFGRLQGAVARAQSLWSPQAPASELKVKAAETFEQNLSRPGDAVAAPAANSSWAKRISLAAMSPAALAAPAFAKAVPAVAAAHAAAVSSGGFAHGSIAAQAAILAGVGWAGWKLWRTPAAAAPAKSAAPTQASAPAVAPRSGLGATSPQRETPNWFTLKETTVRLGLFFFYL